MLSFWLFRPSSRQLLLAYWIPTWMERPQRKISLIPQQSSVFTPWLPNANNVVSLEETATFPNMIFPQEQIQNLMTLANSISTSNISSNSNSTSTANTTSTSSNIFTSFYYNTYHSPHQFNWIIDFGATDHIICSPQFSLP